MCSFCAHIKYLSKTGQTNLKIRKYGRCCWHGVDRHGWPKDKKAQFSKPENVCLVLAYMIDVQYSEKTKFILEVMEKAGGLGWAVEWQDKSKEWIKWSGCGRENRVAMGPWDFAFART